MSLMIFIESDAWDGDECNQYIGTDTTIIPALMTPDEQIWGYDPSICRSIGASYQSKTTYKRIPVAVYEMDLSEDINVKPCFCRDEDTCPPKGTFDLFRCVGVSRFFSCPIFFIEFFDLKDVRCTCFEIHRHQ